MAHGRPDAYSRDVELLENQVDPDPLRQFARWRDEAGDEFGAVALATATPDGAPSLRMVLLKGADEQGLSFFSNYDSRKGTELAANPRAALLAYWPAAGRQVRVEGDV
ncbi:MAG: pyridoxamine 5'-phosphate oxidase family protein, partial [Actinobacteria bacterium]|nr:pyridoxamine 5'-phosphate oxidase family protein [Actinomycetota bacterium]